MPRNLLTRSLLLILALFLAACQTVGSVATEPSVSFMAANAAESITPTPEKNWTALDEGYFEPRKNGLSSDDFANVANATGGAELIAASSYHGDMLALVAYSSYGDNSKHLMAIGGLYRDPVRVMLGSVPGSAAIAPDMSGGYWLALNSDLYFWNALKQVDRGAPDGQLGSPVKAGGFAIIEGIPTSVFITSGPQAWAFRKGEWMQVELAGGLPSDPEKAWLMTNVRNAFLVFLSGGNLQVFQGNPDLSEMHPVGGVRVGSNRPVSVDLRDGLLAVVFAPDDKQLMYAEFGDGAKQHAYLIQDVSGVGDVKGATVILSDNTKYALVLWVCEQEFKLEDGKSAKFPLLVRTLVNRNPDPVKVSPKVNVPGAAGLIPSLMTGVDNMATLGVWSSRTRSNTDYVFAQLYYPNAGPTNPNSLFAIQIGVDNFIENLKAGKSDGGGQLTWSAGVYADGYYFR